MGLKNIRWGVQTFPLGRISLGLLHRGVYNFIPKFIYFPLAWIINFSVKMLTKNVQRCNTDLLPMEVKETFSTNLSI